MERAELLGGSAGGSTGQIWLPRIQEAELESGLFSVCSRALWAPLSSSVEGARGRQHPVPHSDKGIKAHGRIKSRQRGVQERESQHGVWKTQCRHLVVYLTS